MMIPEAMTTEQAQAAWDRIATGFDKFATPISMSLAEKVLHHVDLRPGMRFLDGAAGSGAMAIPAARLGAQVVATDFAPGMVERLKARARAEGLSNLEARIMDGHALELEDDTFDLSASMNGVSLFPNLPRGLRELVRVTRPEGRVLIVAGGSPQKAEFLGFFLGALRAVVPGFTGLPMDPPPLPFQVADPEVLRQRMADAGLEKVHVEAVIWQMAFRSGRHLWNVVTHSNPIGAMLVADLTEEQRDEVRQVLGGMLRERSEGKGSAILTTELNVGIGTK